MTKQELVTINVRVSKNMKKLIEKSLKHTTYYNMSDFIRDSIRIRLKELNYKQI